MTLLSIPSGIHSLISPHYIYPTNHSPSPPNTPNLPRPVLTLGIADAPHNKGNYDRQGWECREGIQSNLQKLVLGMIIFEPEVCYLCPLTSDYHTCLVRLRTTKGGLVVIIEPLHWNKGDNREFGIGGKIRRYVGILFRLTHSWGICLGTRSGLGVFIYFIWSCLADRQSCLVSCFSPWSPSTLSPLVRLVYVLAVAPALSVMVMIVCSPVVLTIMVVLHSTLPVQRATNCYRTGWLGGWYCRLVKAL